MQVTMWLTETMKRFPILILLSAILSAVGITSCKTTEENYRKAYETAVIQRQEATGIDSTIYGKIRNSANTSTLLVGGVELPMRSEYIGYDATRQGETLQHCGRTIPADIQCQTDASETA